MDERINECEALVDWIWQGKTEVPVALYTTNPSCTVFVSNPVLCAERAGV